MIEIPSSHRLEWKFVCLFAYWSNGRWIPIVSQMTTFRGRNQLVIHSVTAFHSGFNLSESLLLLLSPNHFPVAFSRYSQLKNLTYRSTVHCITFCCQEIQKETTMRAHFLRTGQFQLKCDKKPKRDKIHEYNKVNAVERNNKQFLELILVYFELNPAINKHIKRTNFKNNLVTQSDKWIRSISEIVYE